MSVPADPKSTLSPPGGPPVVQWATTHLRSLAASPATFSAGFGLIGLAAMLAVAATIPPILIQISTELVGRQSPTYTGARLWTGLLGQAVYLPLLSSLAVVMTCLANWTVPLTVRFAAVLAVLAPATAWFLVLVTDPGAPAARTIAPLVTFELFLLFIGAMTVAVPLQWSGRCRLSHLRQQHHQSAIGIRDLIELTFVSAVVFAIILASRNSTSFGDSGFGTGVIMVVVIGGLLSIFGLALVVPALGRRSAQRGRRLVPGAAAMALSACLPALLLRQRPTGFVTADEMLVFVVCLISGVVMIGFVAATHLWWLRGCGWECTSARELDNRPT